MSQPAYLTDEHLIPESLGGTLVLPRSVCSTCQVLTGKPENAALQFDLLPPRIVLALPRKRPKKKGLKRLPAISRDPAALEADASAFNVEVEAADYPWLFPMPGWYEAGHLAGVERGREIVDVRFFLPTRRDRINSEYAVTHVPSNHLAVAYSLAKWAYGYVVAERGVEELEMSEMRQMLLHQRENLFDFVGGPTLDIAGDERELHTLTIRERNGWLTVVLNLFGSIGLPPYEVAVARLRI